MQNIEIKAHYNNIQEGKKIAKNIGAKFEGEDTQIDTYFITSRGRFKLRESSLSGAYLVPYLRNDNEGPKSSKYAIIPVEDINTTKELFINILGVDRIVETTRSIYIIENVRIHLDEVKNLGTFFELEAVCSPNSNIRDEEDKVAKLLETFRVDKKDLIAGSYREMI